MLQSEKGARRVIITNIPVGISRAPVVPVPRVANR